MASKVNIASLQARARWASGMLIAYLVATVAVIPLIILLGALIGGEFFSAAYIGIAVIAVGSMVLLCFVGSVIAVSLWVHRAWRNLHDSNLKGLNFSPAFAVGSFYIPILNLVVPFQAMRELYNRSSGEDEYQARSSVADVTSWWACSVSSFVIQTFQVFVQVVNQSGIAMVVAQPYAEIGMGLLAVAVNLGSAFLIMRIVKAITRAQSSQHLAAQAFV